MLKYERCGVRYSGTQGETCAIPCCGDTQHIACMGTKGLARVFDHLHGNGGSAVYKEIVVSLSLDVDRGGSLD